MSAARAQPAFGLDRVSDEEFAAVRRILQREAGMALAPQKRSLVIARLSSRVRELGLCTLREYLRRVEAQRPELSYLVDRMTTHETRFFRSARHFALLEREIFPSLRGERARGGRARHVRLWSAGCASGEEAFSLAMSALWALPPHQGWEIEVLATDVSAAALERAQAATWPIGQAAEIPERLRKAFMLRGFGERASLMRASRELRSVVRFHQGGLHDESAMDLGRFDVIFCCNVLIYFDASARRRAVQSLVNRLGASGALFLGEAESLTGMDGVATCIAPNVYGRAPPEQP